MTASDFNLSQLSRQQVTALRLACRTDVKLWRCRSWWGHRPGQRVKLDVATSLRALGLARIDESGHSPRLVATGAGQQIEAVLAERQERKRA
mgnify:CR=1 FL=1